MSLWYDFLTHDQPVNQKWKHYFPIYELHFARYVNRPLTMIEIGCGEGASLKMWKRYFGPYARIIGLDVNPQCRALTEDQVEIRIGDQSDVEFLGSVVSEFGAPDIVIDDGSHMMRDVCAAFRFLYRRVAPGGIYLVEDLHTAYWEEYEGGYRRPGTFIELCKQLVDELNGDHVRQGPPPTEFTRSTLSMHFYDSVVVFERGRHTRKFPAQMPGWPG
jgi:SAM-dependent methyltransferase